MGAEASTQMDTAGQFFREEKSDAAAPADPNHSLLEPAHSKAAITEEFQMMDVRKRSIFADGYSTPKFLRQFTPQTNVDTPGKFLRMASKSSVDARKARADRRPKGDDDDVSRQSTKESLGSSARSSDSGETPHHSSRSHSDSEDSPSGRWHGCTNEGDSLEPMSACSRRSSTSSLASHASRSSSTSARLRETAANGMKNLKASMCAEASTQMDTAGQFFREEKSDAAAPADPNHSHLEPAHSKAAIAEEFQMMDVRKNSIFVDGYSTPTDVDTPGKFLRMASKSSVDAREASK